MQGRRTSLGARAWMSALIACTAVAMTVGAWHVHVPATEEISASAPNEGRFAPVHECPACAMAHAPATAPNPGVEIPAPTTRGMAVASDASVAFGARVTSGISPRGPPRSV